MNLSEEHPVSIGNKLLSGTQQFNAVIGIIFVPLLYVNFVCVFLLSSFWAAYFVQKMLKDQRRHKQKIKQRNDLADSVWKTTIMNFKTNRVKNLFLLAICLSECGKTFSIIFYGAIALRLDYMLNQRE